MNQNKLSFASENLVVDYISFNISGLRDAEPIANYLFNFGFNSFLRLDEKRKGKVLIFNEKNTSKVTFVKSNYDPALNSFWNGFIVRFSGLNGCYFYNLIQSKKINWDVFDLSRTNLGRLDLHFLRNVSNGESREELSRFMQNSCKTVKDKYPKTYAKYFVRKKGLLLEIGSRGSNHRLRVYEKKRFLEFELEIKKEAIKSYQEWIFSENLDEFEDRLVKHYYKQLKKWLSLDSFYIDWLLADLRTIASLEKDNLLLLEKPENRLNPLVSSYLYENVLNSSVEKEQFFELLRLLSFLRTLSFSRQFLGAQTYCMVKFPLMDFISFMGNDRKSSYQRTKALGFFASLQNIEPLVQKFSNKNFRRSVMFPYLSLEKENRRWTVEMAIGEELYVYSYPFRFPANFFLIRNVYDLEIKIELMSSYCTNSLTKIFWSKKFFDQWNVPNKKRTKIKKQFLTLLLEMKSMGSIENTISLENSYIISIDNLTPMMLSKNNFILFQEKL